MPAYPKRLIEVDLPIRRISDHARREKSIRHGHISTLHIWWARRPLAACRAVLCASLWPDTAPGKNDAPCPPAFLTAAKAVMLTWTTHERQGLLGAESRPRFEKARQKPAIFDEPLELRHALLDFIADFANWDNSTVPAYLDTARYLTAVAHRALTEPGFTLSAAEIASHLRDTKAAIADWPKPLVVDPFAGGGSIPLEALRVGADAFASDLNPIPVLLNKVVLEYIPKYGKRLADEVRKWGAWVKEQAEKELAEFYPKDPDGCTPIAYLWARTIRCEGPGCGAEVPLIRNSQLSSGKTLIGLSHVIDQTGAVSFSIVEGRTHTSPTVKGGSATCLCCGFTTAAPAVKRQLSKQAGGGQSAKLLAVCFSTPTGKKFAQPRPIDHLSLEKGEHLLSKYGQLPADQINPVRPWKNTRGLSAVTRIGINTFRDLYTDRQLISMLEFFRQIEQLTIPGDDPQFSLAVRTLLQCTASRLIFQNTSLSRWHSKLLKIEGAFGKQALQVVWDFAEANPIGNGPANWDGALDWVLHVISANSVLDNAGQAVRARAQTQFLSDESADVFFTDPPYFAAIPYSDLANVFFVWERRFLANIVPEVSVESLIDQRDEIIVTNANIDRSEKSKDASFFNREMTLALLAARNSARESGIGIVVFADSSTESWEAVLGSIIDANWVVTASWPIDTEMQNRTQAEKAASLQSSVHIAMRKRSSDTIGDWRDVLQELPKRIHEWMPRLDAEGVVGADAIFACLGPALEIFSRYSRVERASGEQVTLKEYLEHVWAAVSREALAMVFKDADVSGFEEDARLTAIWLWTLSTAAQGKDLSSRVNQSLNEGEEAEEDSDEDEDYGGKKKTKLKGFYLDYDAARKIAQGLGAHLEAMKDVVEVKGDTARLLPVAERTARLFGKADPAATSAAPKKKKADTQLKLDLFSELTSATGPEAESTWEEKTVTKIGETTLDRVHQSMILFAASRSEALKRFLVDDGAGKDPKFWRLAQALSALYPPKTDERRWVEGVMARKKGLGL